MRSNPGTGSVRERATILKREKFDFSPLLPCWSHLHRTGQLSDRLPACVGRRGCDTRCQNFSPDCSHYLHAGNLRRDRTAVVISQAKPQGAPSHTHISTRHTYTHVNTHTHPSGSVPSTHTSSPSWLRTHTELQLCCLWEPGLRSEGGGRWGRESGGGGGGGGRGGAGVCASMFKEV